MLKNKYRVKVYYKEGEYSPSSILFLNNFARPRTVSIDDVEAKTFNIPIAIIANHEETTEEIILNLGYLLFCKEDKDKDEYSFKEDFSKKIIFNKSLKEGTSDDIDELLDVEKARTKYNLEWMKSSTLKNLILNGESTMIEEATSYLEKVLKYNELVDKYIGTNYRTICNETYNFSPANLTKNVFTFIFNTCRLTTTNLIEIEKLLASGNQYILTSILNREGATLEKGKKLSKVINLPKFALPYLNTHNMENSEEIVRNIANDFDGNTIKIIFDFFDSFDILNKYKRTSKYEYERIATRKKVFLENCYYLMKRDYKIIPLLNYVLRQEMYWTNDLSMNNVFSEPFDQMKKFVDYVRMCEEHNVNYEKFPQDLERSHDITVMNFKELENEEKDNQLIESIKDHYDFEQKEIGAFTFLAPKNIQDLVLEGNNLHHCIGSYTNNIIKNISHIYFMRFSSDTTTSYVTVELDPKTCELVEAKENYNKEVSDDEAIKAIYKFVKEAKLKRGLIVAKTKTK